jgi:arginine utilization regulatory protein
MPLTENFLKKTCRRFNRPLMSLSPAVEDAFMNYDWPGNVREMQNVIEGSSQLAPHHVITYDLVSQYITPKAVSLPSDPGTKPCGGIKTTILDSRPSTSTINGCKPKHLACPAVHWTAV